MLNLSILSILYLTTLFILIVLIPQFIQPRFQLLIELILFHLGLRYYKLYLSSYLEIEVSLSILSSPKHQTEIHYLFIQQPLYINNLMALAIYLELHIRIICYLKLKNSQSKWVKFKLIKLKVISLHSCYSYLNFKSLINQL